MQRRLSPTLLLPASIVLCTTPALAGGETALSPEARAEMATLFEKALTFESSCTEACSEAAWAEKAAAKEAKKKGYDKTGYDKASYASKEAGECRGCGEVNPMVALTTRCNKSEGGWDVVDPLVREAFTAANASEDVRERLLDMLTYSQGETALACAGDLIKAEPAAFGEKHLLTFAQRGSEPCLDKIAKSAKQGAVVPAAFLALRGDETGKRTLTKAAKPSVISDANISEAFLAAIALRELGEKKSLARLQSKVHAAVLAQLDSGNIEAARSLTLRAQHASKVALAGRDAWLANYGQAADEYCSKGSEELAQADDVFHLIEKLTPM